MNCKIFVVLLNSFLFIGCEDSPTPAQNESLSTAVVSAEALPQNNGTEGIREGKQDGILDAITDVISAAAAAASAAASSSLVDNIFGNQMITTGEYCGYRRRHCDYYCRRSFRGPMVGYCRSGICVCECDYYQCERYCRRFWDYGDYDHWDKDWDDHLDDHYDDHYDYPRRRIPIKASKQLQGKGRAYCSARGCRCD